MRFWLQSLLPSHVPNTCYSSYELTYMGIYQYNQTGKGAKIKGSNYNLSGGLITKFQTSNDQIRNFHFEFKNGVVSLTTIYCLLQQRFHAGGRETLQQQQRWSMSAVIPQQTVTKPAVTSTRPSLAYKSRRKKRTGRENGGGRRRDREEGGDDIEEKEGRRRRRQSEQNRRESEEQ
uniref:Uncharacterized protein n=1 Tax=Populus trichocarpa TaxID=3694 RepID=A0A2K2AE97_POPTR